MNREYPLSPTLVILALSVSMCLGAEGDLTGGILNRWPHLQGCVLQDFYGDCKEAYLLSEAVCIGEPALEYRTTTLSLAKDVRPIPAIIDFKVIGRVSGRDLRGLMLAPKLTYWSMSRSLSGLPVTTSLVFVIDRAKYKRWTSGAIDDKQTRAFVIPLIPELKRAALLALRDLATVRQIRPWSSQKSQIVSWCFEALSEPLLSDTAILTLGFPAILHNRQCQLGLTPSGMGSFYDVNVELTESQFDIIYRVFTSEFRKKKVNAWDIDERTRKESLCNLVLNVIPFYRIRELADFASQYVETAKLMAFCMSVTSRWSLCANEHSNARSVKGESPLWSERGTIEFVDRTFACKLRHGEK